MFLVERAVQEAIVLAGAFAIFVYLLMLWHRGKSRPQTQRIVVKVSPEVMQKYMTEDGKLRWGDVRPSQRIESMPKKSTATSGTCSVCGETVLLPFTCSYCGAILCAEHRLPEAHSCPGLLR